MLLPLATVTQLQPLSPHMHVKCGSEPRRIIRSLFRTSHTTHWTGACFAPQANKLTATLWCIPGLGGSLHVLGTGEENNQRSHFAAIVSLGFGSTPTKVEDFQVCPTIWANCRHQAGVSSFEGRSKTSPPSERKDGQKSLLIRLEWHVSQVSTHAGRQIPKLLQSQPPKLNRQTHRWWQRFQWKLNELRRQVQRCCKTGYSLFAQAAYK